MHRHQKIIERAIERHLRALQKMRARGVEHGKTKTGQQIAGRLANTRAALKRIKDGGRTVNITGHALLRYLERVMGLDPDAMRAEMLTDELEDKIVALGTGEFPSDDGSYYLIAKGFNVVTCVGKLRMKSFTETKPPEGKKRKGR